MRQAQRAGVVAEDMYAHVSNEAKNMGLNSWERKALGTLVSSGDAIQLDKDENGPFYINGQHRAQAMLDAGVRRTVLVRWDYPEITPDPNWPQPRNQQSEPHRGGPG